jgi:queuine tRNA-ribosyltransferase
MAVIQEFKDQEISGKIKIISFENDTDPLKLALKNAPLFAHLHHAAPHELLKNNQWVSPAGQIEWQLIQGDFATTYTTAGKPHVIFYDPFSLHTNVELWSEEAFEKLLNFCRANEVQLLNYSASTAVRATLLSAGWCVGYGPATGPKSTTTVAFTSQKLADQLKIPLLGSEWLTRWEKSDAKTARGLSQREASDFEARIRGHEQFRAR